MAALQTLRNKPALLMSVIGGALLLFIITMVMENQAGLMGPDTDAGEIYGKEISIQDFEQEVSEEQNFYEMLSLLQSGQAMTEQQREQIRLGVWENAKIFGLMSSEADKMDLMVTQEDVQNALKNPQQYQETMLLYMVANAFVGNPTIEGYKQFLLNYDKQLAQIRQQAPQNEEVLVKARRACMYAEKRLEKSILLNKYSSLLRNSVTANPVIAKMNFDENNTDATAEIAMLLGSNVEDKDITVSDDDLKKLYEEKKELFFQPAATRAIKMIQVSVVPSPADRAALLAEVKGVEDSLRAAVNTEDIATIVGDSKTSVPFRNIYLTKQSWVESRLTDVAVGLDTLAVGYVKPTTNDGQTVTTFKLVDKITTPDSLLVKYVASRDKAQADSIVNAVKSGSSLGEIAQKFEQPDTAVWENINVYLGKTAKADSSVYNNVCDIPVNGVGVLAMNGMYIVAQVLEAKNPTEKYNVAVVKCPIEFSDATYNGLKSKLDNYLANNKTAEDFEKNAAAAGYYVQNNPTFSTDQMMQIRSLGGDNARAAVRWIFDEAQPGDVSNVFECGDINGGTTLLAVALQSVCEDKYLPWDNEFVKDYLTQAVKQQKKAEKVMAQMKDVKSVAAAKELANVTSDTLNVTLFRAPYNEPVLAGALQKAGNGQFFTIQGANGAYAVQMIDKVVSDAAYNQDMELLNSVNRQMQNMNSLFEVLIQYNGEVKDHRYKF